MDNLENTLKDRLYRAACPDSLELAEYQLGRMEHGRAEAISRHVAECPHCTKELGILKEYMAALKPDVEYSPVEKIRIWLARRILPGQSTGNTSKLVQSFAVRGQPDHALQRFTFGNEGGELAIDVYPDPQQPAKRALLGLLIGVDLPQAPDQLTATLWQAGQTIASSIVDDFGNLAISDLAPGVYDLIFSSESFEIHVQDLTL